MMSTAYPDLRSYLASLWAMPYLTGDIEADAESLRVATLRAAETIVVAESLGLMSMLEDVEDFDELLAVCDTLADVTARRTGRAL